MYFNFGLTLVWLLLIIPTMVWWKDSILWVAMMSIWANVASHFTGYIAGRSAVQAKKGHNLTEADKAWIMSIVQQHVCINNMTTANAKQE